MIDFALFIENYVYPSCYMIDHILFLLLVIPVPFQSLLSTLFLKIKDIMLVKKNKSVGRCLISVIKLLQYCFHKERTAVLASVLCGLTLLKIKLPAICSLKFMPVGKLDFIKYLFLPRKSSY